MLIQITNRCHMGCPHCMQDSTLRGKHMSRETFESVLDFCKEAQPLVINVSGGEPTENPLWKDFVTELLSLPTKPIVAFLTNGAWIEDSKTRIDMARLIRDTKRRFMVQVFSHPKYYKSHEWTTSHTAQFRSIGCITSFDDIIFMQDLGRARKNCTEETAQSDNVPSCINSHLMAQQAPSLPRFLYMAAQIGQVYRPLIDFNGGIHMSESWTCPTVAHVSDGVEEVFRKMRSSRPCKGCRLYKNFESLHPKEMQLLESGMVKYISSK